MINHEALDHNAPVIKATQILEKTSVERSCRHRTSTPWMLWWIVLVHASWGFGLLGSDKVQAALVLVGVEWITDYGFARYTLAFFLLFISTLAAVGLMIEPRLRTWAHPNRALGLLLLFLTPQYFVVLAAFVSDLILLQAGNFNDRNVDRWLLLCALAPVVWGALLHTAAILERYALAWKR